MSSANPIRSASADLLAAVQFLTRIPVPTRPYETDSLARSVKFFPLVGLLIGAGGGLLHVLLAAHLPRLVLAFLVVLYLVLVTGGLHEDALADAADGFGGGRDRASVLHIMRDSRIGAYGGLALVLSVLGRVILIASLPLNLVSSYLMVAGLLSRWSVLPLSFYVAAARTGESDGQGARLAGRGSAAVFFVATALTFAVAISLLKTHALAPLLSTVLLTWLSGAYFKTRIDGVTGDCFGATIQIVETACCVCGVWIA